MARVRSPNYPNISLKDAVERVRKVHEFEGKNDIDRSSFVEILGYNGITGPSSKLLSSLSKYGLIEKVGTGEVKISERAMDILFGESEQKYKALRDSSVSPSLYSELKAKWPDRLPSDENLKSYLARQGFSLKALENVMFAFRETMEYVDSQTADYSPEIGTSIVPVGDQRQEVELEQRSSFASAVKPNELGFDVGFDGDSIRISGVIVSSSQAEKVIKTISVLMALLPNEVEK